MNQKTTLIWQDEFFYYEWVLSGSLCIASKSYLPPKMEGMGGRRGGGGIHILANNSKMAPVLIASLRTQYQQPACQYQYCHNMGGI